MVLTARQVCGRLHGIFADPLTVGPSTQTSQRSSGLPSSSPRAVRGSAVKAAARSPPPTTSQRQLRAPCFQASADGRNHAQVIVERSIRLSSAPRNRLNRDWQRS